MTRFIQPTDYAGHIKPEILKTITNTTDVSMPSQAQVQAEDTAIATIREYIGGRYDCNQIFSLDQLVAERNLFVVSCVIKLALYFLYHQTSMKDVPEHRKVDYDDTIQWLKDVGRGAIRSELPILPNSANLGEIRWETRKPRNLKW